MINQFFKKIMRFEAAGGVLLMAAALLAMIMANSPMRDLYHGLIHTDFAFAIGDVGLNKPLLLWINDGLMALFFLNVGLEIKREIIEGQLSSLSKITLPTVAAFGGVLLPSLIYIFINHGDATAIKGWAIPAATDIAFSLGVLILLGKRVPPSLKIFLVTLAIIDDLAAVLIIAVFYAGSLSYSALLVAFLCLCVLVMMNRMGVYQLTPYLVVGVVLWLMVLNSGVHATLAGVLLAFTIPLSSIDHPDENAPARKLEQGLYGWVNFCILPIFAFANAGIDLSHITLNMMFHPIALGTILGLFVGKQVGIFLFAFLIIKLRITELPQGASWLQLYGVAVLCGIGFTMSFFISSLAFGVDNTAISRAGIMLGSLLSAIVGYVILYIVGRKQD